MTDKYILIGREAKAEPDLIKWAQWVETANRSVADGQIGDVRISTVFLGLDHNFGDGPPLLFETLVFGGPLDGEMQRYSTYDEAEQGHRLMVSRVGAP